MNIEQDWKKYAAQVHSDQDVEKAFLDQAYMFIQNKATPLMKPPYRLGFEIVFKNDANSRMVGIFAFKVGSELLYAPAFFINGSIKGTDLLYRHRNKSFVPLTNEWANYLLGMQENKLGQGISKEDAQITSAGGGIDMERLAYPPSYNGSSKSASYAALVEANDGLPSGKDVLESLSAELLKESSDKSLVRKFILEDGGYSAVELLTDSMAKNANFAQAVDKHVGLDNVLVQGLNEVSMADAAFFKSCQKDTSVQLHMGFLNDNIKEASEGLSQKGYVITDKRASSDVVDKVYNGEHEGEFSGPSEAGIYQVLNKDGTYSKCLVAPCNELDLCSSHVVWDTSDYSGCSYGKSSPSYVVVDLSNKEHGTFKSDDIVTVNSGDDDATFADEDIESDFSDTPSVGKHYKLLDVSGKDRDKTLSRKFYVRNKVDSANGVDKYEIDWSSGPESSYGDAYVLTLNPDYEGADYESRTFQKGSVVFVEVKDRSGKLTLANNDDLYNFVTGGTKIKKASLHSRSMGYYVIKTASYTSPELSELSTICSLIGNEGMSENLAESLVKKASKEGVTTFYYPELEKKAFSFGEVPEFYQDVDEDFNISRESPQSVSIIADSDEGQLPSSRIGDSMKFENGDELGESGPMELAQLADEMGASSLFDHGVVGSLAKTYDSSLLVEKYMPDLESALDKLGRMIFLFYWKPEDFSNLYGSDDQASLENLLLSNFKSFGELVLELLKKTQSYSESVGRSY